MRDRIEEIIASGDVTQCQVVFTNWDSEGTMSQDMLELVATESATQRMIVQQEVEIDAEAAVYQPPPEISVDTGTPEIVWSMPRQNVTINEPAPEIVVRQGQPRITVEVPQPRVTIMIPEPEIFITWPDPTADVAAMEPTIEVRIPEPVVTVNMPPPVVELTIGGSTPENLTRLDDGRFAPQGATEEDLAPRVTLQQQEATISPAAEGEAPDIRFNRGEPTVTLDLQEPEVVIQTVGEPEVRVVRDDQQMQQDPNTGDTGAGDTNDGAQDLPATEGGNVLPDPDAPQPTE